MDLDILYKNAKYFKEKILSKTFILKTKGGHIVIRPTTSDFRHLIGVQHSLNEKVLVLKANNYFEKVMAKEILIDDLTLNIDENNLTQKQTYILNKNFAFIPLFDDFLNSIELKKYNKYIILDNLNLFMCDYYHNKLNYTNSGKISDLEILGIKGQERTPYFCFNSILKINKSEDIKKYRMAKTINVYEVLVIENNKFEEYLNKNEKYIIQSSHYIKNTNNKKNKSKNYKLNNKNISDINNKLNKNFSIKKGAYGKNTIQLYKNNQIIEQHLEKNIKVFHTIEEIVDYINEKYK